MIYLLGATGSDTDIATSGSYQPVRGGMDDAFLVRFSPATGYPLWGTYYGGPGDENVSFARIVSDGSGEVTIAGYTDGTAGIAKDCAVQMVYGGGPHDGFVAKYDTFGRQLWSSYYGGNGEDILWGCASKGATTYICGYTNSTDSIASPGSFLSTGGGSSSYEQGFIAKITDDGYLYTHSDTLICVHSDSAIINLQAHAGINYNWFDGDTARSRIIDSAGIYRVAYTFGCRRVVDTMHVIYNVSDTPCSAGFTQVKTIKDNTVIFPNPATNECTISFSRPVNSASMTLFDITGRAMRTYSLAPTSTTISIADIPAGMYQCRILIDNSEVVEKKLAIIN
jgi:hypothetical protein